MIERTYLLVFTCYRRYFAPLHRGSSGCRRKQRLFLVSLKSSGPPTDGVHCKQKRTKNNPFVAPRLYFLKTRTNSLTAFLFCLDFVCFIQLYLWTKSCCPFSTEVWMTHSFPLWWMNVFFQAIPLSPAQHNAYLFQVHTIFIIIVIFFLPARETHPLRYFPFKGSWLGQSLPPSELPPPPF